MFLLFAFFIYEPKRYKRKRRASYALIYFDDNGEDKMEMQIGQSVTAQVAFVDAKGFPAKVDGAPVWSVSDAALCEMTVSEGGMSASFKALAPGGVLVSLSADADLGEGVKSITGEAALNILEGEAVGVVITFGNAE